ncbi:hypothetical protein IAR55_002306 [Kwoniella newhampshirensis]|uniref:Uncharacterized protein n=1 Tax=Kwoniella newhampshirensis TaxID=1651941 RepID=A0AAW0YQI3_9TREE
MYWYISFLRPPPVSVASTADGITITSQVANDLRTELRYEPTTIHYQWQQLLDTTPAAPLPSQELTTFLPPASTYRTLHIPLPPRLQIGQRWRLGLFSPSLSSASSSPNGTAGPSSSTLLDLTSDEPGLPLGVWSEGIIVVRPDSSTVGPVRGMGSTTSNRGGAGKTDPKEVVKNGKAKGKGKEKEKDETGPKQGRITRDWMIPGETGRRMKIVEQTSFDLDKKIWDSGLALSSWLFRYLPSSSSISHPLGKRVIDLLNTKRDLRVVELGSGTGLVSVALGLALQDDHLSIGRREITATDLESAIPLMDENLALNDLEYRSLSSAELDGDGAPSSPRKRQVHVDARVLDWDQPIPSWVASRWPELIIAADVTYNTSAFPSLLQTLTTLLQPPSRPLDVPPLLVLAYKQRHEAERELWSMLRGNGVDMVMVDTIPGAEEEGQVEIWVGGADLQSYIGARHKPA